MNLFRRKSVTDLQAEALTDKSLHRALGPVNLTALGVGAIIGTGIFVLTGTVAAQNAGPAVVLSFILAGLASIFAALCYSEFASLVPMAGSAYTYGYATLGELFAWIIGWDLILEYAVGAITVAIGWSGYVVSFLRDFGIVVPPQLAAARGTELIDLPAALAAGLKMRAGWTAFGADLAQQIQALGIDPASLTHVTAIFNLPAVLIIFVVTTLLVVGIKESANFNNVIVMVKVAVVLLFIAGGVFVMEALSVILQVGYYKATKDKNGVGKRIFRMAPLHHHFEKIGWKETQVVVRFWIITILLVLFGLSTLKIR